MLMVEVLSDSFETRKECEAASRVGEGLSLKVLSHFDHALV